MRWSKKQIYQHKKAAATLKKIIFEIIDYIKTNPQITDVAIRKFVAARYRKCYLKSDRQKSIVAFGNETSSVHFSAERPRKLKQGDLIMIDIWAKLDKKGAPFADITWMLYYGRKVPKRQVNKFKIVAKARGKAAEYIKNNLKKKIIPTGKEIDATVRNFLAKHELNEKFLHGTGHSLGFSSPHGRRTRINRKGKQPLPLNVGYTIEPGIYFKNEFGIRSEINFYINESYKFILTTAKQNKIILI